MARIEKFEDIDAWKKARLLTGDVYAMTREGPVSRDFRFIDQIRSAATSVMSNIAEGYERDGNAEFRQFLYIAKASAGEVRSLLYVGLDAGYIQEETFRKLSSQAFEVIRMVFGFIRYLEQSDLRGRKYSNDQ